MKYICITALAAALGCFSAGSMAQSFYVGANAGTSSIKIDCEARQVCDESGTAYRLTAGYLFGNGFAVEAGFASFGKATARDGGLSATLKASGAFIGGAYTLPVNDSFGIGLRAGLINMKAEVNASITGQGSGSASESKAKGYFGVGLNYTLSKSTRLEMALDSSRAEVVGDDGTVRAYTLGVRYSF